MWTGSGWTGPLTDPRGTSKVGDINNDGSVNLADFSILASNYGKTVSANTLGDLNGSGRVDLADFSLLASNYGK